MFYINTVTLEYPLTADAIRAKMPNVSFPEAFEPVEPFAAVVDVLLPEFDHDTHYAKEQPPVFADGVWRRSWAIKELDAETVAANRRLAIGQVRSLRNSRLAACDWTQLSDAPVNKDAWSAYRQALRDVTSQPGFPFSVTWPAEPA